MPATQIWKYVPPKKLLQMLFTIHAETLDEANEKIPQGVYTTFRTYQKTKAIRFGAHIARLVESARLMGKNVIIDEIPVRAIIRNILKVFPAEEARIRITLDLSDQVEDLYFFLEKLVTPSSEDYAFGAKAITRVFRRTNPKAKSTGFISMAKDLRQDLPAGINEVILVDDQGQLLEGLSSNFFGVKDGCLVTAEEEVLAGITRSICLEEAARSGIPVRLQPLNYRDLNKIQEAFITSTSRAILPVIQIDGIQIGNGLPGIITRMISAAYEARINANIEEI